MENAGCAYSSILQERNKSGILAMQKYMVNMAMISGKYGVG